MSVRFKKLTNDVFRWFTIVLLVAVVVLFIQIHILQGAVDDVQSSVTQIKESSQRTEKAADELVAFVHEIQSQQGAAPAETQQAVQTIINVLCSSSDPVRLEACSKLSAGG